MNFRSKPAGRYKPFPVHELQRKVSGDPVSWYISTCGGRFDAEGTELSEDPVTCASCKKIIARREQAASMPPKPEPEPSRDAPVSATGKRDLRVINFVWSEKDEKSGVVTTFVSAGQGPKRIVARLHTGTYVLADMQLIGHRYFEVKTESPWTERPVLPTRHRLPNRKLAPVQDQGFDASPYRDRLDSSSMSSLNSC